MNATPNHSSFLQFVKYDLTREQNNYSAVIIKALIESGFDHKIRVGKSKPYMAKPPILSVKEIYKKLKQSNFKKLNFDVTKAVKSTLFFLRPFVYGGPEKYCLTLEFSAREIPTLLKICNQKISLK